jgi:hypothetical protein
MSLKSYAVVVHATVEAESAEAAAATVPAVLLRDGGDVSYLCQYGGLTGLHIVGDPVATGRAVAYEPSDLAAARSL